MNKKTRAVAILLVAVMILSLVASMVIPYFKESNKAARSAELSWRASAGGDVRARRTPKGPFSFRREYPLEYPRERRGLALGPRTLAASGA